MRPAIRAVALRRSGILSGLLAGAAQAVSRARRHQSVSVVWTDPESGITSSRLTTATIIGLIDSARSPILLVGYATGPGLSLRTALDRSVEVTLLAARHADNPSYNTRLPSSHR